MSNEEWRDVVGWEGVYAVSDLGRVKRIGNGSDGRRLDTRIKNCHPDDQGYARVNLWFNNTGRQFCVHRLVGRAFLGPRAPGSQINHINGNKMDNRLSNLEYCTSRENVIHAISVLGISYSRKGEAHGMAKLTEADVKEIRRLYKSGAYTQVELGRMYGVSHRAIGRAVAKKNWRHVD